MSLNSANSWMNASKLSRFSQMIANFEGEPAIMREPPSVNHVLVSNVVADADSVRARITLIPTPGMPPGLGRGNRDSNEIFSVWEIFSFSADEWSAQYVSWKIYFDPALIHKVVAIAAEAAERGEFIDERVVPRVQSQVRQARRSLVTDPTKRSS
jgi:hypothetical protein